MGSPSGRLADARSAVRTLGVELPLFAGATLIDQAGRLVLNLIAAALLGPAVFGTWVVVSLVLQYANLLSVGVGHGAGREVPRFLGAGDSAAAERAEDAATGGTIVSAVVAAGLAVLLGPWLLGPEATVSTIGWLALAVLLQQLFLLEQVLFRSRLRFRAASLQLAAQGVLAALVGGAALASGFGLDGLLIARVTVFAIAIALAGRTLARTPRPAFDPARVRALIVVGGPILLAGFLVVVLVTIDRWLVLVLLGREATGVYGLVGVVVGSMVVLPMLISQQFYPRLAHARGAGAGRHELHRLAAQQGALAGGLTAIAAAALALGTVVLVPRFLPAYGDAVRPMLIVLVGLVALAGASAYGNLLNLLDRQRTYLAIQVAALVVDIVGAVLLMAGGFGLIGVASASSGALVFYALLLRSRALAAVRDDPGPSMASGAPSTDLADRQLGLDGA